MENETVEKEILSYVRKNNKAYPSDIADALNLDFDLVIGVVKGLIKEGRLK